VAYVKDYRPNYKWFSKKVTEIRQTITVDLTFTKQVSNQLRDIVNFFVVFLENLNFIASLFLIELDTGLLISQFESAKI
jgi:hypothetical protein